MSTIAPDAAMLPPQPSRSSLGSLSPDNYFPPPPPPRPYSPNPSSLSTSSPNPGVAYCSGSGNPYFSPPTPATPQLPRRQPAQSNYPPQSPPQGSPSNPSLTHVVSAPQVMVSPPQRQAQDPHKSRPSGSSLKTLYAKTQKNKYTRFATKLAVGTLTASILGADLSDLADGFDGMDIGDSADVGAGDVGGYDGSGGDGFDGTTYGDSGAGYGDYDTAPAVDQPQPDTDAGTSAGGLPSNPADTTTWMEQQTWQNVTLPQLAGAPSPALLTVP